MEDVDQNMGDVEIELWTEENQSDYARILASLPNEKAEKLYNHLWETAVEWVNDQSEDPDTYKRLTGRNVDVADAISWFEEEGFLERTEEEADIVFTPSDSVQEALRTDAENRTVLFED